MTSADQKLAKTLEAFTEQHRNLKEATRLKREILSKMVEQISKLLRQRRITLQKLADGSKLPLSFVINVLYNDTQVLTPWQAKAMLKTLITYGEETERMGQESQV